MSKYKLVRYGQGSSDVRITVEVKDKLYREQNEEVLLSRVGGMGLDLIEFVDEKGGGLVMVNEVAAGSNAAKPISGGKFLVGDVLTFIQTEDGPRGPSSNLQGLGLDDTLNILAQFSAYDKILLGVKRLVKRNEIVVQMVGPQGEDAGSLAVLSGYGVNLRTLLQSHNMAMYDSRTARFDSPYQTGNCGGDGTCGTCVVSILGGKDLINDRVRVEDMPLRKLGAPPNYRWACRTLVGPANNDKGVLKIKLRPQTTAW